MLANHDTCWAQQAPFRDRAAAADGRAAVGSPHTWYVWCKSFLDFALALTLLLLTAPLVVLAALLIKLTSRGPVFYCQTRLGRHGKPYTIIKLRTMLHNCERRSGPKWSQPGDPRVTPVGRFLRKSHLDELPQLFNVLRGEMSLVGPRPERPEFVPQLERVIPHYRKRLEVRPGLTGLAQIQLPPDSDLASVRRKLAYDLYYVHRIGPWLDFRILVGTALYVLGVPFPLLRRLTWIPRREAVEQVFHKARGGSDSGVAPAVQTV
jgi:lipopolysaccharide/colanic/teichoic acid biosynthesis glycosyltransferase